jgi:hypothetical protein
MTKGKSRKPEGVAPNHRSMPGATTESGMTIAVTIEEYLKAALKAEKVTRFGTQPDHTTRLAAAKLLLDWTGVSTQAEQEETDRKFFVNVIVDSEERRQEIIKIATATRTESSTESSSNSLDASRRC